MAILYFRHQGLASQSTRDLILNFNFAGAYWVTLWSASIYNTKWLDKFVPWVENPLKRTLYTFISMVAYTFLVVTIVDLFLDVFVLGKTIPEALKDTSVGYVPAFIATFSVNVIMHGRAFLLSWRQSSIDVEKLRTEQVSTQYQSLRNQVNPHFLFNALNALSSLVYDDQEKAVEFIRKLSHVYRYVLDQKDAEMVKVQQELDFAENFIFLQQIRFGENLKIEVKKESGEGLIPPLAIQLLVENAIKHNVVSESYPLTIGIDVGKTQVKVYNTIKEKISKDSTGIGLKNLRERYKYLTNKELTINNNGKTFEVILPIIQEDQKESTIKA